MTKTEIARDLVGYGPTPPHAHWPNNARIAVNFVVNYEEGSENTILEGDGRVETGLAEVTGGRMASGIRDLGMESLYEYGSRAGIWRLFRIFEERDLPLTVFGCAVAMERNPQVAEAIVAADYDVCGHGWRWVEHYLLEEDEEREHIARAVETIKRLTGHPPRGWYCRYAPSVNTRRLLVEHGGFLYDSDSYADDLPYWTTVMGKSHLVVPYSLDANDLKFQPTGNFSSADSFYTYLKDAFDFLYLEGEKAPKMMNVGLHARMMGRPARAAGLARFLDYIQKYNDVWVCRRLDIAEHWAAVHPSL
ncbi:MAG: allantoinase PuuE [Magnetovibrio sp.]|nr:allantoinase PuuE [Magnetovibrio sp.]